MGTFGILIKKQGGWNSQKVKGECGAAAPSLDSPVGGVRLRGDFGGAEPQQDHLRSNEWL